MNSNKININEFFSTLDTLSVAKEIIDELSSLKFTEENYTIDFTIRNGKMECSKSWNTLLKFDTTIQNSKLKEIIKIFDLEEEVTNETIKVFENFRIELGTILVKNYSKELSKVILSNVFKTHENKSFDMKAVEIDISDLPDIDYVIVVRKRAPQGIQTDPVTEELFEINSRTGMDFNEIIKEKKQIGDPRYKYVEGCDKKKHFFEINLYLLVNYTK